jgi:hypothetical protein
MPEDRDNDARGPQYRLPLYLTSCRIEASTYFKTAIPLTALLDQLPHRSSTYFDASAPMPEDRDNDARGPQYRVPLY